MFIFTKSIFYILKYFYLLTIAILFFSCDDKPAKNKQEDSKKPLLSVVHEYSDTQKIKPSYRSEVEEWKELRVIDKFLERFKKASPHEILSNAIELKGLVKNLKDSIKPTLFNKDPSFDARINIFYNETLRLADMTSIPAIKAEEVNVQTEKTIAAFSAVNAKINTILAKKRFEEAIDVDGIFVGLDSTKMDSVSRKSVNINLREQHEQNKIRQSSEKLKTPKIDKNSKFKRQ